MSEYGQGYQASTNQKPIQSEKESLNWISYNLKQAVNELKGINVNLVNLTSAINVATTMKNMNSPTEATQQEIPF